MKPKWLQIAEAEIGQHEVRGGENPRIVEYHACTSLKATTDEVPWCSSFVNWCLKQAGEKTTGSAAARSWLTWGRHALTDAEELGAVIVIRQRRTGKDKATGSASGYHVGFLIKRDKESVTILGGNQGDSVKYSTFPLSRYEMVDTRWPADDLPIAA